jgi:hypothetical protein
MRLVDHKPDRAWAFIVTLVECAPSDDALGWVGAGPLEDILCDYGPAFIDRVESIAGISPRFRICLRSVWRRSMDPSVYSRMRRAAGMDSEP